MYYHGDSTILTSRVRHTFIKFIILWKFNHAVLFTRCNEAQPSATFQRRSREPDANAIPDIDRGNLTFASAIKGEFIQGNQWHTLHLIVQIYTVSDIASVPSCVSLFDTKTYIYPNTTSISRSASRSDDLTLYGHLICSLKCVDKSFICMFILILDMSHVVVNWTS